MKITLFVGSALLCSLLIYNRSDVLVAAALPNSDCSNTTIDLLLVAHGIEHGFREQMKLFSLLIDLILNPHETELHRLKVALLVYTATLQNGFRYTQVFDYSQYVNRTDIQEFLEHVSYTNAHFQVGAINLRDNRSLFDALGEARDDAYQISVLITEHLYVGRFLEDWNKRNNTFITFLVIVDKPVHTIPITIYTTYQFLVKDYASLEHTHLIAVTLCGTCFREWFLFKQRGRRSLLWRYSCYILLTSKEMLTWVDAFKRCMERKAIPVTIETTKELHFLRFILNNASQAMRNDFNPENDNRSIPIPIGLLKSSFHERFRWINEAPLTLTHWGNNYKPNGGITQSCVSWMFGGDNYPDNWDDVGCGHRNAHLYLCEATISFYNPGYMSFSNLTNPSAKQIDAALLRGELAICQESNSLVSASEMISRRVNEDCILPTFRGRDPLHHWSHFIALFNCEDQPETVIAYSFVCDYKIHCPNGRDEAVCMYRQCDPLDEFTCDTKQCVPAEARCDLYKDCYDGSDEILCLDCKYMQCQDGTCVPTHWWYDDEVDCSGGDMMLEYTGDNDFPRYRKSVDCAFLCNRTQCVTEDMMGDGVIDCTGPEGPLDETLGALDISRCGSYTNYNSTAWSPKCVYYRDRYDSPLGCRNMKHLRGCRDFTCPGGYLKCPGSYCIPMHQAHDGRNDCPLGEDEMNEFFPECPGNFVCMKSRVCVYIDLVCDGFPHCPEGDDELNCQMSCGQGFLCVGGAVTVYDYDRSTPLVFLNFIDPRVRYVDLSGVILSEAFFNVLQGVSLNNLNVLRLSGCGIQRLDIYTFSDLSSLKSSSSDDRLQLSTIHTVDLSYNKIKHISTNNIFTTMHNLRVLNLSHNQLNNFVLFKLPSSLRFLDLSYTEITSTYKLFDPLVNLTFLNLSHTPLSDLRYGTFSSKGKLKLQVLDLRSITLSDFYPDTFKGVTVTSSLYTDTYLLCCPQVRGRGINSKVCHAPADPLSTCSDLMGDELKRVLLWLAGSMAVLGNLMVIVYRIRWTRPLLKKAYGMFVVHLAVSDVIMGVYLLIIASADVYYRNVYIWHEKLWRSHTVCQIAGFASMLSCEVSTCFVFMITLDRFLVIKYPLSNVRLSRRVTIAICFLVWLVSSVVALVPLFPKFKHWSTYSSNGMCLGLPLTSQRLPGWQFSSAIYIGFNCLLFLLIVIGQITIYRIIAAASRKQRDLCAVNSARQQQDFAAARQLFLVAMTNFLCWFPIGVMGLVSLSGYEIGLTAYAWSAVLIMPVNSALNPVLYTIPALMDKFHQLRSRDTSTIRRKGTLHFCSKCQSSYSVSPSGEEKI